MTNSKHYYYLINRNQNRSTLLYYTSSMTSISWTRMRFNPAYYARPPHEGYRYTRPLTWRLLIHTGSLFWIYVYFLFFCLYERNSLWKIIEHHKNVLLSSSYTVNRSYAPNIIVVLYLQSYIKYRIFRKSLTIAAILSSISIPSQRHWR